MGSKYNFVISTKDHSHELNQIYSMLDTKIKVYLIDIILISVLDILAFITESRRSMEVLFILLFFYRHIFVISSGSTMRGLLIIHCDLRKLTLLYNWLNIYVLATEWSHNYNIVVSPSRVLNYI